MHHSDSSDSDKDELKEVEEKKPHDSMSKMTLNLDGEVVILSAAEDESMKIKLMKMKKAKALRRVSIGGSLMDVSSLLLSNPPSQAGSNSGSMLPSPAGSDLSAGASPTPFSLHAGLVGPSHLLGGGRRASLEGGAGSVSSRRESILGFLREEEEGDAAGGVSQV